MKFGFVGTDGTELTFDIRDYERPFRDENDPIDSNWLRYSLTFDAGDPDVRLTITAEHAAMLTHDLPRLRTTLTSLLAGTASDATFGTLEPYVEMSFDRGAEGVEVLARVRRQPGIGPTVEHSFEVSFEEISRLRADLARAIEAFPVR